jgi:hypothetical protein
MTSFALSIAAGRIPSEHKDSQDEALRFVGNRRVSHDLTPMERESAIEICELREIFYTENGQPELAEFMRTCQAELAAGRNYHGDEQ